MAVTVGAIVAAAAAVSGAGSCAAPSVSGGADVVCYNLVRTLAERMGIATGAMTAILTLTVVGLSRLVTQEARSQLPDRTR